MMLMLLLFTFFNRVDPDISKYRSLLDKALHDKKTAGQLYQQLKTVNENDAPVLLGFRAMSEFMLCKHLLNPISKLSHFNRGRDLLELAIKKGNNLAELHYFRLATQSNTPSILGYHGNTNYDKILLINYLKSNADHPSTDKVLYKRIRDYLLINQYCSAQEKAMIKSL